MVCVERLLDIVETVFAPVCIHELPVSGKALLLLSHGKLAPGLSLVVVIVTGEAYTEND